MKDKILKAFHPSNLFRRENPIAYSPFETLCIRIGTLIGVLTTSDLGFGGCRLGKLTAPSGIARLVDITFICHPPFSTLYVPLYYISLFVALVLNIKQLNFLMYLICTSIHLIIFTMENSHGVTRHVGHLTTLVLLMRTFVYGFFFFKQRFFPSRFKDKDCLTEEDWSIYFTQQMIAAHYVVCGYSKLYYGNWFSSEVAGLLAQVVKANQQIYFSFGKEGYSSNTVANLFVQVVSVSRLPLIAFPASLILEFTAYFFLFNRFTLLIGGISCILMHEGIARIMSLYFPAHQVFLVTYLVMPWYWICLYFNLKSYINVETKTPEPELKYEQKFSTGNLVLDFINLLKRIPFKFCLVLTLICWISQEKNYPLSNFPMYARTEDKSFLLYITDGTDQPLPTQTHFLFTSPFLKRKWNSCYHVMNSDTKYKSPNFGPAKRSYCAFIVLDTVVARMGIKKFSQYTQPIKIWRRNFKLNTETTVIDQQDHLVLARNVTESYTFSDFPTFLEKFPAEKKQLSYYVNRFAPHFEER